jgi:isopropylmalate/homocitrate/citramalate synthase
VLPLSEVYNAHIYSSHRGTAMAASLHAILEGVATNSNSYNGIGMRAWS